MITHITVPLPFNHIYLSLEVWFLEMAVLNTDV